jgi:hypothetical protein
MKRTLSDRVMGEEASTWRHWEVTEAMEKAIDTETFDNHRLYYHTAVQVANPTGFSVAESTEAEAAEPL